MNKDITVLAVNDDPDALTMWKLFLDRAPGLRCIATAGDGPDAIEIARALNPQIILMDVMLPLVNGIDATREIMLTNPETIIIVFTVHPQATQAARRAGAAEALQLPASPTEMIETIRRVFAEHSHDD